VAPTAAADFPKCEATVGVEAVDDKAVSEGSESVAG